MRTLLLTLALTLTATLTSCVSTPVDIIPTDGAIGRQIERVVARHDTYTADPVELAQSAAVRSLSFLGSARRSALAAAFAPVADRHDRFVLEDATLEQLEVDTYMASTEGLRRLLGLAHE